MAAKNKKTGSGPSIVISDEKILEEVSLEDMLSLFHEPARTKVAEIFSRPGVRAMVVFENDDVKSVHRGTHVAVAIGPTQKIKSVADCAGRFLGEPPDDVRAAKYFCNKD